MKTGKHLKVREMGDNVMGVTLEGNPKKPEPIHFRVEFPGGDVDVVRCDDGSQWVHVRVNKKADGYDPDREFGSIVDARIDCLATPHRGLVGDLGRADVNHIAVRIQPERD